MATLCVFFSLSPQSTLYRYKNVQVLISQIFFKSKIENLLKSYISLLFSHILDVLLRLNCRFDIGQFHIKNFIEKNTHLVMENILNFIQTYAVIVVFYKSKKIHNKKKHDRRPTKSYTLYDSLNVDWKSTSDVTLE